MTEQNQNEDVTTSQDTSNVEEKKDETPKEPTPQEKVKALLEQRKEEGLSLSEELQLSRLQKKLKKAKRNQNAQREMFEKLFLGAQKKRVAKMMKQVRVARELIGREDYKMLRDIFTVKTEEKKDEKGNVLSPARTDVNYYGLLLESKNVIAMQREQRIKAGKRKRSTGRSSDRRAHKSLLNFLLNRNAEEAKKTNPEA